MRRRPKWHALQGEPLSFTSPLSLSDPPRRAFCKGTVGAAICRGETAKYKQFACREHQYHVSNKFTCWAYCEMIAQVICDLLKSSQRSQRLRGTFNIPPRTCSNNSSATRRSPSFRRSCAIAYREGRRGRRRVAALGLAPENQL